MVISDEVYEHLTYDLAKHIPIATLPGMFDRTLTVSSAAKSFSLTGWKIGWVTGPAPLVTGVAPAGLKLLGSESVGDPRRCAGIRPE